MLPNFRRLSVSFMVSDTLGSSMIFVVFIVDFLSMEQLKTCTLPDVAAGIQRVVITSCTCAASELPCGVQKRSTPICCQCFSI